MIRLNAIIITILRDGYELIGKGKKERIKWWFYGYLFSENLSHELLLFEAVGFLALNTRTG